MLSFRCSWGNFALWLYKAVLIKFRFTPAAWEVWDDYNMLGKAILTLFLFICHFLIVTILITVSQGFPFVNDFTSVSFSSSPYPSHLTCMGICFYSCHLSRSRISLPALTPSRFLQIHLWPSFRTPMKSINSYLRSTPSRWSSLMHCSHTLHQRTSLGGCSSR